MHEDSSWWLKYCFELWSEQNEGQRLANYKRKSYHCPNKIRDGRRGLKYTPTTLVINIVTCNYKYLTEYLILLIINIGNQEIISNNSKCIALLPLPLTCTRISEYQSNWFNIHIQIYRYVQWCFIRLHDCFF